MIPRLTIFDVSFAAGWDLAERPGLTPDDDNDDDVADGDDNGGDKEQDHCDRRDVQLPRKKKKCRNEYKSWREENHESTQNC